MGHFIVDEKTSWPEEISSNFQFGEHTMRLWDTHIKIWIGQNHLNILRINWNLFCCVFFFSFWKLCILSFKTAHELMLLSAKPFRRKLTIFMAYFFSRFARKIYALWDNKNSYYWLHRLCCSFRSIRKCVYHFDDTRCVSSTLVRTLKKYRFSDTKQTTTTKKYPFIHNGCAMANLFGSTSIII